MSEYAQCFIKNALTSASFLIFRIKTWVIAANIACDQQSWRRHGPSRAVIAGSISMRSAVFGVATHEWRPPARSPDRNFLIALSISSSQIPRFQKS
jgi:hypothetical protein